jgi:formylglycine-generating enzyme required for sulfatase activity/class 3 adenylate cyclase
MSDRSTRRLATILIADIVGYSRLMGAAERDTVMRVAALQRELIEPTIIEHRGTVVQVRGDGFYCVFDSPVECVRAAIVIQQSMVGRNLELPPNQQIRFRIGINIGDVIMGDEGVLGDGVNVAARLEADAAPGTINISGSVYEQVRHKLVCGYQSLGDKRLKNIQDPVLIYRVLPDPASVAFARQSRALRRVVWVVAGTAFVGLLGGVFLWDRFPSEPTVTASTAPAASPPTPPKPMGDHVIDSALASIATQPPALTTTPAPPSSPLPQTAVVTPKALPPPAAPIRPPEMVAIEGGSFLMGSTDDPSEKPVHRVSVLPFLISKYLVTKGQWRECVKAAACFYTPQGGDEEPVGNVNWIDAQQYLAWLSQTLKAIYRLPTEAEWELAARGGTTTRYWWGDVIRPGYAICKGCGGTTTTRPLRADLGQANPYGIYVNAGLSEWVADCWVRDYTNAPVDGSARVVPDCTVRVLRGASWTNDAVYARPAARDFYDATVRYPTHGFRVARSRPY